MIKLATGEALRRNAPRQKVDWCSHARPVKRGSRRNPDSRRLRRASTRQLRHALPVQCASEGGRSPPEDKSRAGSNASEPRQEHRDLHDMGTFDSAATATRRRAWLPPSGPLRPRMFARARVGHGSHAVVIDQTQSSIVSVETENRPCRDHTERFKGRSDSYQIILFFLSQFGHGGSRSPRQLETVCARDYDRLDRLFRLPANCSRCKRQIMYHLKHAWVPDRAQPQNLTISPLDHGGASQNVLS